MRRPRVRTGRAGYVSLVLVLSTGTILSLLMIYAYRRAMNSHTIQSRVQLRVDYSEKEEAILRSIVAITPNRAIRAMQAESNSSATISNPLRWQDIFTESLALANSRTSISAPLMTSLNISGLRVANTGDSDLGTPSRIFAAIAPETGYVSPGINRALEAGYPAPLVLSDTTAAANDKLYPLITHAKSHGTISQGGVGLPVASYPAFNLVKYPQINFGYARPGDDIVARRNWWAFSVDVADHDDDRTFLVRPKRNFVLSIYEIPSQLSISAASHMSLGRYASGDAWTNVNIDGGMFVGKADVLGDTALPALASRRGMTLSSGTTIGGRGFTGNPFSPGVREEHQVTQGDFFPVSLASESGRAAFIAHNRGAEFFDRYFLPTSEPNAISPTTWNNYTVGAQQCAMRLDISQIVKSSNPANITPTHFRFSYLKNGVRQNLSIQLSGQPPGYYGFWPEDGSYNFGTDVVDVAYGKNGVYTYKNNVTGLVTFNNATFGDPLVGTVKTGYLKLPFEVSGSKPDGRTCVAVYPQRFKAFLAALGADSTAVNSSLVVNVDYKTSIGDTYPKNPLPTNPPTPYLSTDYGVILKECGNLTSFTKGFSLVTNMRLYIGDDFNIVPTTPPAGYTPAVTLSNPTGRFMPPCSLFAPDKRYGVESDPFAVNIGGQVGSLASETATEGVRPLDAKTVSGNAVAAERIHVNLSQIRHPSEVPPIVMMNWLVVLEERRKEFY
ncbi:hypothetical protein JIN84_08705 [Luteolibacter yonseiensis]|uniref:Uncharacterized protein n=1 Tax=Luteolibacter yonseiensis TaxID=1144680 RepID=A0A934VBR2_9BACT|nr:hypothetical protein [Luteolibacter yonseiensis]MBK1815694.1 hypothetical protein [Luteolibacter yonseiensis]